MLLLTIFAPLASAADFLQTDAAAPGMAVTVHILRSSGGFTAGDVVTTSCADIAVGPVWVNDGDGNPSAPVSGAVLTTVFYVDSAASTGDCTVYVNSGALVANGEFDNRFSIVTPLPAPVDGGTGDADGAADGVITVASTDRSDGGVVVFESLTVGASELLSFDASDPDSSGTANPAFLPAIVLVAGTRTSPGSSM